MKVLSEIKGHIHTDAINVKDPYYGDIKVSYGKPKSQFLEEQIRTELPVENGEENEKVQ